MDAAKALKGELNNKIMITTRIAGDTKLDNASALAEAGSFWKFVEDNPKAVFLLVGPNPMFRLSNAEKRLNAKAGK